MGSGKSSVGREIARRWHRRFLDTDSMIRRKYAKSIPEIFAHYGEETFRAEEQRCLRELQGEKDLVLSTGGGIAVAPENRLLLRTLGLVVWLTASEEIIWHRVSRNADRPLLQTRNPRETIKTLLLQRNPIYEEVAHLRIETSDLTHQEVADCVLEKIEGWLINEEHN
jgi:shikimate kinase